MKRDLKSHHQQKKQALIDQLEQQLLDAMAAQVQSRGLGVLDVTE
jgi:hypothetical protein